MKPKNARQLYLIAEGEADQSVSTLNEMKRPLSAKGVSNVLTLVEAIKEKELACPDLILCSSGLCARQSLDLLYEAWPACDIVFKDSLYSAMDYRIFDVVKVLDDILYRVMIVTEDAALTPFVGYVAKDLPKKTFKFVPASCGVLSLKPKTSWHTLGKNTAELSDFFQK